MSGPVGDNTARASGVVAAAGGGAILQVKAVQVTSTISAGSGSSPVAISAFDIAFTPTADNSVLCLQLSLSGSPDNQAMGGFFYDSTGGAKIMPYGDAGSPRQRLTFGPTGESTGSCMINTNYTAWFTPGDTTTRTIQVHAAAQSSTALYVNRTYNDSSASGIYNARSASTFTITEYDGSIVTVA